MFLPLNASMLNTGPATLGLSVIAVGNAAIDARAISFTNFERTDAVGIAKTNNPTQTRLAAYWGSVEGIAEQISVQNKIAAGYGTLVAKSVSDMQIRNATRRFYGKIEGKAETYADTLYRTVIGFGIWVAEAEAASKPRIATKWFSSVNTVAAAYQESNVEREILLSSSSVYGLADVFAWRLLAPYSPAYPRRLLILNTSNVALPRLSIVRENQLVKTFTKHPSERLDYDILGEKWLRTEEEFVEVLERRIIKQEGKEYAEGTLKDEGTVIRKDGKRLKIWLSGGVAGEAYLVSLRILTKHGLEKEVDFYVNVMESPYETKVC